jgi:hypothetical protein
MLDSSTEGGVTAKKQARVSLGPHIEDVSLRLKDSPGDDAENAAEVTLSAFQQDPEDPKVILAHADIADPEFGPIGSFPVRLKRRIHEARSFMMEHRGEPLVVAAGIVAVGSLVVRHHHHRK